MKIFGFVVALTTIIIFTLLIAMNFNSSIDLNIITSFMVGVFGLQEHIVQVNTSIVIAFVFILGEISAFAFLAPIFKSLTEKQTAYKRELEKKSVSDFSSTSRVVVLENKIKVLEKALDNALKK